MTSLGLEEGKTLQRLGHQQTQSDFQPLTNFDYHALKILEDGGFSVTEFLK
jgi:hypothetical protein